MAQVVQHLPSKCEALSLNPNVVKKIEEQWTKEKNGAPEELTVVEGLR
jgi:hypothetical protein